MRWLYRQSRVPCPLLPLVADWSSVRPSSIRVAVHTLTPAVPVPVPVHVPVPVPMPVSVRVRVPVPAPVAHTSIKGTKLWTVIDAHHIPQIPFLWEDGNDPLYTRGGVVDFTWEDIDFKKFPGLARVP